MLLGITAGVFALSGLGTAYLVSRKQEMKESVIDSEHLGCSGYAKKMGSPYIVSHTTPPITNSRFQSPISELMIEKYTEWKEKRTEFTRKYQTIPITTFKRTHSNRVTISGEGFGSMSFSNGPDIVPITKYHTTSYLVPKTILESHEGYKVEQRIFGFAKQSGNNSISNSDSSNSTFLDTNLEWQNSNGIKFNWISIIMAMNRQENDSDINLTVMDHFWTSKRVLYPEKPADRDLLSNFYKINLDSRPLNLYQYTIGEMLPQKEIFMTGELLDNHFRVLYVHHEPEKLASITYDDSIMACGMLTVFSGVATILVAVANQ